MTQKQITTAKQILAEYYDLIREKPIVVNMGNREIIIKRNGPVTHPYFKEIDDGKILFGIGTENMKYDTLVIEIGNWKIINSDGAILNRSQCTDLELKLVQQSVELSGLNERNDLIRFR